MTTLFSAPTRLEAWLDAIDHILDIEADLNIILSITSPGSDGAVTRSAKSRIDAFYASEGKDPLHTIAETIFPGWEYRHRGLRGVFETYLSEYEQLKNRESGRWGTYAHRLIYRRTATGEIARPLEILINKMRDELHQKGRGTYRSCYELGIAEGEYDLPLYNTVDDQRRRRGGPCLSHLSFKLFNGCVHLAAIYRSHDYRYKVLGNLLGLARLQACVAHEVGVPMGSLVVHSTYAYVDFAKAPLKELIADLRSLLANQQNLELSDVTSVDGSLQR
jgi:hypothetical protein